MFAEFLKQFVDTDIVVEFEMESCDCPHTGFLVEVEDNCLRMMAFPDEFYDGADGEDLPPLEADQRLEIQLHDILSVKLWKNNIDQVL